MRKFLLPILFLIFSCEEVLESIKEGCTTTTACNYDAEAMKDDGSCIAKQGCNEWCEGDSLQAQEFDCADVCGGMATVDECGVCEGTGLNQYGCCWNLQKDCVGECGGNAEIGECGLCINSYLTCPEEEECYNVGYNDPCPDLGCCPYPYLKSCSCDGKCGNALRIGDGGCDKPGLGGGHDGWDGRCYFEDGGDC